MKDDINYKPHKHADDGKLLFRSFIIQLSSSCANVGNS